MPINKLSFISMALLLSFFSLYGKPGTSHIKNNTMKAIFLRQKTKVFVGKKNSKVMVFERKLN
jgi:hypothetical protein